MPSEHTFNVNLANGEYLITLVPGDQDYAHAQIDIYAEECVEGCRRRESKRE
jgi:hypothetical protein